MMSTVQQSRFAARPRFGNAESPATPPAEAPKSGGLPVIKSQADFQKVIGESDLPLLVKFEKPDCLSCKEVEPFVEALAKDNVGKVKVVKALMWDPENPDNRSMKKLAFQYKLKTVPYFIYFEKGAEVLRGEGKAGLDEILAKKGIGVDSFTPVNLPPAYKPPGAELTVLFDGECEVCKGLSEKLKTLDKNDHLALVPLQSPEVRDKYPDLKLVDLRRTIHVVRHSDGKIFTGADAFAEMGKVIKAHDALGRLLKVYSGASKIPGFLPVADKVYLAFSKRRFKIKAKQSGCKNCTLEE